MRREHSVDTGRKDPNIAIAPFARFSRNSFPDSGLELGRLRRARQEPFERGSSPRTAPRRARDTFLEL
jgi:hypothetical protein